MSVRSRLDKIRQASKNAVLTLQYSFRKSFWNVRSLRDAVVNYRIVIEWQGGSEYEDVDFRIIKCTCQLIEGKGLEPCQGNNGTVCYHSLAVLTKAADEKGKKLVLFDSFSDAHHYSNFGGTLVKIRNDHQGHCWAVVEEKRESRLAKNVGEMRGLIEEGID